jgi:hypothetical protein
LRPALAGLPRYIATVETTKHRVFQFLGAAILPDNMLVAIASDEPFHLGVLSSRIHMTWTLLSGATLEDRPRYSKSRTFDPFPFPDATEDRKAAIGALAEELDAHRKSVLAAHPHLTLTGLYNVLERLRAGVAPGDLDTKDRRVFDDGLVLVMKDLHDRLDIAVAGAYGWPADLDDQAILARLVALNRERAVEEKAGQVRWLRPDYQIPRFGTAAQKAELDLTGGAMRAETGATAGPKPAFPRAEVEQTAAVMAELVAAGAPLSPAALAGRFRQGRRAEPRVKAVLASLVRMGFVATEDSGATFTLRRAA